MVERHKKANNFLSCTSLNSSMLPPENQSFLAAVNCFNQTLVVGIYFGQKEQLLQSFKR